MTKEGAREHLENWINYQTKQQFGEHQDIRLPIIDEVVLSKITERGIEQWTFKGLIKIAYDL